MENLFREEEMNSKGGENMENTFVGEEENVGKNILDNWFGEAMDAYNDMLETAEKISKEWKENHHND